MKPVIFFISIFLFIFTFTSRIHLAAEDLPFKFSLPSNDQDNPVGVSAGKENTRISLSLRNIDIIEALKFFSMKSGLNIVPTQSVAGRVTLSVENAPINDVFDIMLRSNNLAYDKHGDIYNVMTEDEYRKLYGRTFSDTRVVKIFRLKYAIPEQAFNLLDALKSEIGRLLVDTESGAVMIIDTPEKIAEAQNALAAMEQKGTLKVFTLKYAKAKDVEEQLKTQLDLKKVGMVRADDRSNQVIVQTLPERMKDIETLIASLDKKTKAVLIDTKIIQIHLSDNLTTGIQWEGIFALAKQYGLTYLGSYPYSAIQAATSAFRTREQVFNDAGGQIGSYPFSGTTDSLNASTKISPGEKMHIGVINKNADFDAVVNYLQTLGKTKIISNPSLAVINNQEAKIHIGQKRAYVTTTTTTGTTTKTVSEEVTYVDVGVQLSITPMINDDGYVTMKVKPEISSVVGSITTSSGNLIPIIDTSTAETTIIAKDGSTIILGGLGSETKTEDSKQVPFLGRIPFLGVFFRNRSQTTERTELAIMITPIIFEGDKLITAKDKENEKFGPKPKKSFDVFRPEIPLSEIPGVVNPIGASFTSKELKSYETKAAQQETQIERLELGPLPPKPENAQQMDVETISIAPSTSAGLKEREGLIIFKGFKTYN